MEQFIWLAVFISISGLSWFGMSKIFAQQLVIRTRLEEMAVYTAPPGQIGLNNELTTGFQERIWNPMMDKIFAFTQKYTPVRKNDFVEKKLDYAGRPFDWNASTYLTAQYGVAFGVALLALAYGLTSGGDLLRSLLIGVAGLVVGYLLGDAWLNNAVTKHQKAIEKELPDALDLLTISIEAGLGFDSSMQRVVEKATGPLAKEFNQTIQEMRMGKTRREALRDMALRNGIGDLTKFVDAIMQADQLGVSLGNVLRSQSDQIRVIRRQRVEEQAMKAPVKMLIPMVLFIFPTIFIVLLGPALIEVMKMVNNL